MLTEDKKRLYNSKMDKDIAKIKGLDIQDNIGSDELIVKLFSNSQAQQK